MALVNDLNTSQSTIRETKDGYTVERIAVINELTGTADQKLLNAISDAALPDIGDAHPQISTIKLISKRAEVIDTNTCRVVMTYAQDDNNTTTQANSVARISATTSIEETKLDINGAEMSTVYTVINSALSWSIFDEAFIAEVERPRLVFDFTYRTGLHPIDQINQYLGKVNSAVWNGYPVDTILCSNIQVSQEGAQYEVNFTFIYNDQGWQFTAKTEEPAGNIAGTTDPDLDTVTGTKEFDVYEQVDFNPLGFTFQGNILLSAGGANLAAQAAQLSSTGEIEQTGTGALAAGSSSLAGTGEVEHTGTGALAAQDSAISGTGTVTP